MNVIGFSGITNNVAFKKRAFPHLTAREYRIAQGFDSAAALVGRGGVTAAAAEERFTGDKATGDFPVQAIQYCLRAGNLAPQDLDCVAHGFAYADYKPYFDTEEYRRNQYQGLYSAEVQVRHLEEHFPGVAWKEKFVAVPHHLAHAASAFYPSGFDEALLLVSDGMGEMHSLTIAVGQKNDIRVLQQLPARHSLGILYGVFTLHLGFFLGLDEYKVMGLAPYGNPRRFFNKMMELATLKDDGTYFLPIFAQDKTIEEQETHSGVRKVLAEMFGPPREPEGEITQDHKDIAAALQALLQTCQMHVLRHFRKETGQTRLCMAGGVALNCTANGIIKRSRLFDQVFVQPASGDDGTALGAALYAQRLHDQAFKPQKMSVPLWGPEYDEGEIQQVLAARQDCSVTPLKPLESLCKEVATRLGEGQILGWFQGRMEFGPRALGSRSILADPRDPAMRDRVNSLVKKREGFRPFAPVVTREAAARLFEITPGDEDTYAHMLYVVQVRPAYRNQLPAVTHVDGSARIQTVSQEQNPRLWALLNAFEKISGFPILLNTSFNVRGQPIVRTPQEAVQTFLTARLDGLVLGDYLLEPKASELVGVGDSEAFRPASSTA